jgi:hypothetical protein
MEKRPREYEYHLRHVERFPPGTPYPSMISTLVQRISASGVSSSPLVVDQTAVGRAFIDRCRKVRSGFCLHAISVSAGQAVQKADDGTTLVPKRDLVMALQMTLQTHRLKIAPEIPQATMLTSELSAFRMRRVPLTESAIVEWREGKHDDLVFAVALAVWYAERHPPLWPDSIRSGGGLRFPPGVFNFDDDELDGFNPPPGVFLT